MDKNNINPIDTKTPTPLPLSCSEKNENPLEQKTELIKSTVLENQKVEEISTKTLSIGENKPTDELEKKTEILKNSVIDSNIPTKETPKSSSFYNFFSWASSGVSYAYKTTLGSLFKEDPTTCCCKQCKQLTPKEISKLTRNPSTKNVNDLIGIKGIVNLGNSCYQNSAMQVLINLIETAGEEHFKIYDRDRDEITGYLRSLARKDLLIKDNEKDTEEVIKRFDWYMQAFEAFEGIREAMKDTKDTSKELRSHAEKLRQAVYELHFKNDWEQNNHINTQRDSQELLTFLLAFLDFSPVPFHTRYDYSLNEENAKKAFEIISSKNLQKKEEKEVDLIGKDPVPMFEEQKYKFDENLKQQPFYISDTINQERILDEAVDIKNYHPEGSLKDIVLQKKDDRETFYRGVEAYDEKGEKKVLNFPLDFPYNKDPKYKEHEPIKVVEATKKIYLSEELEEHKVPPTIISLKRVVYCNKHNTNMKHNLKVSINEKIEINLCDEKGTPTGKTVTQHLVGACIHPYGSANGGHWIAYRKTGDKWYRCDDNSVKEVTDLQQMFNQMSVNGTTFTYA